MTDEREAFLEAMEDACIESCEHNSKDVAEHNITIAADAYAAAERLDEHVKTCEVTGMIVGESDVTKNCGDGWYCEDAPIKERS